MDSKDAEESVENTSFSKQQHKTLALLTHGAKIVLFQISMQFAGTSLSVSSSSCYFFIVNCAVRHIHTVHNVCTVHKVYTVRNICTAQNVYTVHKICMVHNVHTVHNIRTVQNIYTVQIIHTVQACLSCT